MTLSRSLARLGRTAFPVALCVGMTVALTACGGDEDPDAGTNGVGKLSPAGIEKKAKTAARGADAVRLAGTVVTDGQTYKLSMSLKEAGGTGSVSSEALGTFELLRVGDELFLKADAEFWTHPDGKGGEGTSTPPSEADSEAADKLDDKYVKVPEDDPSYDQLRGFTDKTVLLDGLLGLHGKLGKGDRSEIGGIRTIEVNGSDGAGGSLNVSLEGTPYPLQLARAGGAGTLTLSDWGKDFPLKAPSKGETVDYGSTLPSS
ncbi:lipoprotein [Streptomyces camponoticapitis]|uniref:Lipoprotein n=1 Tax=Streptomyces camponoticapitis TaxID=1616125 RepID=A0ABQ2EY07_9ACTN|nr:lipoprotein [Streptomyces camponoticapitis]